MTYTCETCQSLFSEDDGGVSNDAGEWCGICHAKWERQSALDAGIPESVIDGKTKLRDHFSQEYIDSQCNREPRDGDE